MSGFVPSTRECLQRLDRMRDTGQIVADLEAFNRDMFSDSVFDGNGASELNAAIARLRDLHQLALHLVVNMSGGAGVPPTPATRTAAAREVTTTAVAKPPVTQWTRTERVEPAKPPKPERKPAEQRVIPANRCTLIQLLPQLGKSESWLSNRMQNAGFPRPCDRVGKTRLWDLEAVNAWLAAPAPVAPPAPGYTSQEAAARIGCSVATLHSLRERRIAPEPISGRQGLSLYWDRAEIDAFAAKRAASPPKRGRPSSTYLPQRSTASTT